MPSLSGGCDDADAGGDSHPPWNLRVLWQLQPILPGAALLIAESSLLYVQLPFLKSTYFAYHHLVEAELSAGVGAVVTSRDAWDVDCGVTPTLMLCKVGATDAAYWDGLFGSLAGVLAAPSALALGILSDAHGRKPLLQLKAALGLLCALLLLAFTHAGWSLWPFLFASAFDHSVDAAGVMLAVLADVTRDCKQDRSSVMGILAAASTGLACICLPVAAVLPTSVAVQVVVLLATLRLGVFTLVLPETGQPAGNAGVRDTVLAVAGSLQDGLEILQRHLFMHRLALVLALAGAGLTGRHLMLRPYLASHFGADKGDLATLVAIMVPAMLLCSAGGIPRLVRGRGEVAALKASMPLAPVLTLCVIMATSYWQVLLVYALLGGPGLMFGPLTSAVKANLVADDEQGKVQGVVAALRAAASAAAGAVFGVVYRVSTQDGHSPEGGKVGLWLVVLLETLAALLAITLPDSYALGALAQTAIAGGALIDDSEDEVFAAPSPKSSHKPIDGGDEGYYDSETDREQQPLLSCKDGEDVDELQ